MKTPDNPTPSPAPQEVPQWAYEAAKEINARLNTTHYVDIASLIARHAQPALSAATEENERLKLIVKAQLDAELAELAELRLDRELLDCVDSSTEIQVIGGRNEFGQPFWIAQHRHKTQTIDCAGKSARDAIRCLMNRLADFAAIDAARKQQENRQ